MSREAVVTGVTEKEGVVLIDCYAVDRGKITYRKIPMLTTMNGLICVPDEGQKVIVTETENGTSYVEGVLTVTPDETPSLSSQEYALQFDPSTKITATKDGSGNYTISIEASGDLSVNAEGNVSVSSSGDVSVDATNNVSVTGGNVTIGEDASAVEVAVQEHTHDYEDTLDDGSTTTKTTQQPNEQGTSTTIE